LSSNTNQIDKTYDDKEDEIFKSLSHNIRRKIVKSLGENEVLSFTQIKNSIGEIDSPTLSYHLKSLKMLVDQNESLYKLTDIGLAAVSLMDKIDQSDRLKNSKKKFLYANIATVACWTTMQIIVGNTIMPDLSRDNIILLTVLFQVFAQLNYQIAFSLWGRSWYKKKGDKLVSVKG